MPDLTKVRLSEPSHRLPMPGSHRFFGEGTEGVEMVNPEDPFWANLIADGSLHVVKTRQPGEPEAPADPPPADPAPKNSGKKEA